MTKITHIHSSHSGDVDVLRKRITELEEQNTKLRFRVEELSNLLQSAQEMIKEFIKSCKK
jgi:uncharacterized protein involved in exopolysaccharide biosynthesis